MEEENPIDWEEEMAISITALEENFHCVISDSFPLMKFFSWLDTIPILRERQKKQTEETNG
jgi:hypothetical protein